MVEPARHSATQVLAASAPLLHAGWRRQVGNRSFLLWVNPDCALECPEPPALHTVSVQRLKRFGQYHLIDAPLLDEVKPCRYVGKIIDAPPKTSAVTQDTSRRIRALPYPKQSPIPRSIVWNEMAPFHLGNVTSCRNCITASFQLSRGRIC